MLRFVWLVFFFFDNIKIMPFSQNLNKNSFRILYHCNICTNGYHEFLRLSQLYVEVKVVVKNIDNIVK